MFRLADFDARIFLEQLRLDGHGVLSRGCYLAASFLDEIQPNRRGCSLEHGSNNHGVSFTALAPFCERPLWHSLA